MKCGSSSGWPASSGGSPDMASANRSPRTPMADSTTIVLWGIAALILGWTWVPALIAGLGGSRYANGGTDDPSVLDSANEPDYRLWSEQLASLGYEPIGAGFMRLSFHG